MEDPFKLERTLGKDFHGSMLQNELQEKGLENRSLGELRLHWQEKDARKLS